MALEALFNAIAAAIHEKDGKTDGIAAEDFPARILAIPAGIEGPHLESIEIAEPPLKTIYTAGEEFDPSDMSVYANFSDGNVLHIDHANLTFDPTGPLEKGTSAITVNFQWGLKMVSASQPILVWWSPHMTDNAKPAPYVASADAEYTDSTGNVYYAYKAFDGSISGTRGQYWYSAARSGRFVQLYFGDAVAITGIRMFPAETAAAYFPKMVTVQVSEDGNEWATVIDNSGEGYSPESKRWREIIFASSVSCRYCKLLCGAAYNGQDQSTISEIEFL